MKVIEDVLEFHKKFGVKIKKTPGFPSKRVVRLRLDLIKEEYDELREAIEDRDLIATADALADLMYVVTGTALSFGIPLEDVWDEVQKANMSKTGGNKRKDGKILKPKKWRPPDIESALFGG